MAIGQGWRFITKFPLIALPPSLLLYTQWTSPVLMTSGPDSTTQREHVQTHGSPGGGEQVPGEKKTTGTAVLESGASVLQSFKPINQVATTSIGFPAEFLSCMLEVVSGRWEPLGCACGQSSTFCCFRLIYEVLSRLSAGVACGVGSDAPDLSWDSIFWRWTYLSLRTWRVSELWSTRSPADQPACVYLGHVPRPAQPHNRDPPPCGDRERRLLPVRGV